MRAARIGSRRAQGRTRAPTALRKNGLDRRRSTCFRRFPGDTRRMGMEQPHEGKTYPLRIITGGGEAVTSELTAAETPDEAHTVMYVVSAEHPDLPPAA
jgi:hypothetical protein